MFQACFIGGLAKAAGVRITTIRFYERKGLLPAPPRRASGYRVYGEDSLRRLRFIQEAKSLGFSLHEIQELLALRAVSGRACLKVRERATQKIQDVEGKIRQLRHFREALRHLVAQCETGGIQGECPMLEALEHSRVRPVRAARAVHRPGQPGKSHRPTRSGDRLT